MGFGVSGVSVGSELEKLLDMETACFPPLVLG